MIWRPLVSRVLMILLVNIFLRTSIVEDNVQLSDAAGSGSESPKGSPERLPPPNKRRLFSKSSSDEEEFVPPKKKSKGEYTLFATHQIFTLHRSCWSDLDPGTRGQRSRW
jgi:hypothetical protein